MKDRAKRKVVGSKRRRFRMFVAGFVAAILCFVALNAAMKPVSSSEYCGGKCHEMNTAYQTWELSSHGANKYGFSGKLKVSGTFFEGVRVTSFNYIRE